jgi:hypothetical protein
MREEFDPVDLKALAKAEAERKLQDRFVRKSEESDLKWLMSSERGRRVVWRLLDQSGVFRLSFNTNAMQMAFAEGNRNYGNRTLSLIHTLCPEQYPTMVKENANDRSDA